MAALFRHRLVPQLLLRRLVPQFHRNCRHSSASSTFSMTSALEAKIQFQRMIPDSEAKIQFQSMMSKCPFPHIQRFVELLQFMERMGYNDVAIDCIKEMLQFKAPLNSFILEASPVTVRGCRTIVAKKSSTNSRGPPLAVSRAPPKSMDQVEHAPSPTEESGMKI